MYLLIVVYMSVALAAAGARGDTEQVVARCQHPVASRVALNMPHWAMPRSLLQRVCMSIKIACNGGTFVHHCQFFIANNHSQRPCYGPLKLKLRHSNIYNNVISLLLYFGHPQTTMDAVLATIVAGGQARIILNIEVDRNKLMTTLI